MNKDLLERLRRPVVEAGRETPQGVVETLLSTMGEAADLIERISEGGVSAPQPYTDDEVREAINILIAHLEHYWGFCRDAEYEFDCASCNANQLRRQIESIAGYLGADD